VAEPKGETMKNITKKGNTFYANFTNPNGTRIRKSLGKDKVQARIKLLQLMADVEIQSITPDAEIPKSNKGKSFELAVNEFIKAEYKIQDAWSKKKFDQYGERQAQFVTNTIRDLSISALLGHRSIKTTEIYANWVRREELERWV